MLEKDKLVSVEVTFYSPNKNGKQSPPLLDGAIGETYLKYIKEAEKSGGPVPVYLPLHTAMPKRSLRLDSIHNTLDHRTILDNGVWVPIDQLSPSVKKPLSAQQVKDLKEFSHFDHLDRWLREGHRRVSTRTRRHLQTFLGSQCGPLKFVYMHKCDYKHLYKEPLSNTTASSNRFPFLLEANFYKLDDLDELAAKETRGVVLEVVYYCPTINYSSKHKLSVGDTLTSVYILSISPDGVGFIEDIAIRHEIKDGVNGLLNSELSSLIKTESSSKLKALLAETKNKEAPNKVNFSQAAFDQLVIPEGINITLDIAANAT
jgi:hypothetical protein